MKKSIVKKIQRLASTLPIKLAQRRVTDYFTAEEVNEAAKQYDPQEKRKLKTGTGKLYPSTTTQTQEVNHVQVMKNLYSTGGWPAVDKYIAQIKGDE
jgi:hypothetical protein